MPSLETHSAKMTLKNAAHEEAPLHLPGSMQQLPTHSSLDAEGSAQRHEHTIGTESSTTAFAATALATLASSPAVRAAVALAPWTIVCFVFVAAFVLGRAWGLVERRPQPEQTALLSMPLPAQKPQTTQRHHELVRLSPRILLSVDKFASNIIRDFVCAWLVPICGPKPMPSADPEQTALAAKILSSQLELPPAAKTAVQQALNGIVAAALRARPAAVFASVTRTVLSHDRYASQQASTEASDGSQSKSHLILRDQFGRSPEDIMSSVAMRVAIHALSRADRSNAVVFALVNDILARVVLRSVVDWLADPHTLNTWLLAALVPKQQNDEKKTEKPSENSSSAQTQPQNTRQMAPKPIQSSLSKPKSTTGTATPLPSPSSTASNQSTQSPVHLLAPDSAPNTSQKQNSNMQQPLAQSVNQPAVTDKLLTSNRQVWIKIREARRLPIISHNAVFCAVVLGDHVAKTQRVSPDSCPVWEQEFQIPLPPSSGSTSTARGRDSGILIDVLSFRAILNDELLGSVYIPMDSLSPNRMIKQWFPLDTADARLVQTDDAALLVEMVLIDTDAADADDSGEKASIAPTSGSHAPIHVSPSSSQERQPPSQQPSATSSDLVSASSILSSTDSLTSFMQFLESRQADGYLQLYIMIDTFRQLTSLDVGQMMGIKNDADTDTAKLEAIRSDAHQVLNTAFGAIDFNPDDASSMPGFNPPLDFGDASDTHDFVYALRQIVDETSVPHPDILSPLQKRIEDYMDRVYVKEFVATMSEESSSGIATSKANNDDDRNKNELRGRSPVRTSSPARQPAPSLLTTNFTNTRTAFSSFGLKSAPMTFRAQSLFQAHLKRLTKPLSANALGSAPKNGSLAMHGDLELLPVPAPDPRQAKQSLPQPMSAKTLPSPTHSTTTTISTSTRLEKIQTAMESHRSEISSIDMRMQTADPSTYPQLLDSKVRIQTEIDALMDMATQLSDASDGDRNSVADPHGHDHGFMLDVSLLRVRVEVVDDEAEISASDPAGSRRVSDAGSESTLRRRHPPRRESLMDSSGSMVLVGESSVAPASSISDNMSSIAVQQPSDQPRKPSRLLFRLCVEPKTNNHSTKPYYVERSYADFVALSRALCAMFMRAENVPVPELPPALYQYYHHHHQNRRESSMSASTSSSTDALDAADRDRRHAEPSHQAVMDARRELALKLDAWLRSIMDDPVFVLADVMVVFVEKTTQQESGADDNRDASSTEPTTAASRRSMPIIGSVGWLAMSKTGNSAKRRSSSPLRNLLNGNSLLGGRGRRGQASSSIASSSAVTNASSASSSAVTSNIGSPAPPMMMLRALRDAGTAAFKMMSSSSASSIASVATNAINETNSSSSFSASGGFGSGILGLIDEALGDDDSVASESVSESQLDMMRSVDGSAHASNSALRSAAASDGGDLGVAPTMSASERYDSTRYEIGQDKNVREHQPVQDKTDRIEKDFDDDMDDLDEGDLTQNHRLTRADLNLILECSFTAIEEIFQLSAPSQWIRQQGLHMVRLVLHQTYGDVMADWLQQRVQKAMAEDSVVGYIDHLRQALWPGDVPFSSKKPSIPPDMDTITDTRIRAKSLLMNGGQEGSFLAPHLGTLFRVVGRYNAVMGLKRVFNSLQSRESNRVLASLIVEAVVVTVLDERLR